MSDRLRPDRKGSASSTSSGRGKGQPARSDSSDVTARGKSRSSSDSILDLPPSYDEVEKGGNVPLDGESKTGNASRRPLLTRVARLLWPAILVVPLGASLVLLYLITCSSGSLRPHFSVIKIALPSNIFQSLSSTASSMLPRSTGKITARSRLPSIDLRGKEDPGNGYLSLYVWGWCLGTNDAQRFVLFTSSQKS